MNVKFMFLFSPNFLTYVTKNMKDHSDVSYGQDQKYTHAHAHDSKHTHSWHMRKGSSSGEEVRESPVFVYQRQGGANLIPRSVQLKHALMPPLLLQDFLSLCFSLHVHECVSVFLFFFLRVRASQRSSEEARGGGRPQERAPQDTNRKQKKRDSEMLTTSQT